MYFFVVWLHRDNWYCTRCLQSWLLKIAHAPQIILGTKHSNKVFINLEIHIFFWQHRFQKWKHSAAYYGWLLCCGKNAGKIIIHCGQVWLVFGKIKPFSDKENNGELEMPAPFHHHTKLNKLTGVNLPHWTMTHTASKWCTGKLTPAIYQKNIYMKRNLKNKMESLFFTWLFILQQYFQNIMIKLGFQVICTCYELVFLCPAWKQSFF